MLFDDINHRVMRVRAIQTNAVCIFAFQKNYTKKLVLALLQFKRRVLIDLQLYERQRTTGACTIPILLCTDISKRCHIRHTSYTMI